VKKRTKAILIISPKVIVVIAYYVFFMPIDEYSYNKTTSIIQKDGVEYVFSNSLPSIVLDKQGKTIGKIKGSDSESAERWVIKIKGVDEHEMFLVTGLMNVELFVRKDKVEEIYKILQR
jgi:methyl coenzyme M reductase subunit D